MRKIVGTAIELLAAIPSIVYGMWGLFVLVPLMQKYVQPAIQHTPLGQAAPVHRPAARAWVS